MAARGGDGALASLSDAERKAYYHEKYLERRDYYHKRYLERRDKLRRLN